MKKIVQLGITPIMTVTTAAPTNIIQPKWYDVELSNEYEEDGEIHYQKRLTAKAKVDGYTALSQGDNEDDAVDNIREAIELMKEVIHDEQVEHVKKFIADNKDIFDELSKL